MKMGFNTYYVMVDKEVKIKTHFLVIAKKHENIINNSYIYVEDFMGNEYKLVYKRY